MQTSEKSKPGRKPVQDKKEAITIYLKPSDITKMGGKDSTRDSLLAYIEKLTNRR